MDIKTAEQTIILSVLPNSRMVGLVIFIFVFLISLITTILYFSLGNAILAEGDFPAIFGWYPKNVNTLVLFLGGSVVSFLVFLGLTIGLINKVKIQNIKKLLRHGTLRTGVVISNTQNFNVKVGEVPQRIVSFKTDNGVHEYRFFSEEWANLFPIGTTYNIRCSNKKKALPDPTFLAEIARKI